jgi:quercetin dioxygenase-like cupin family protein
MKLLFLASLPLLIASAAIEAKPSPSDLAWMDGPPGLPSGVKMAVVSGDPGKSGMFTIQLKMPADYAVPAHSHPTDEVIKVVSGTLHYGMSDKLDTSGAKTLTVGQSATMKATMNHWVHVPVATTLQVSAMGPFEITYVNPSDDPRKK